MTFDVIRGSKLEDMDTSMSKLEVDASSLLFQEGRLRLRCVATQYTLYRRSSELDIHEDTPQIAPVLGPTAPHSHGILSLIFWLKPNVAEKYDFL